MCFPTMQTLSNRGIQDSLHLEAHHSSSASGHLWWSYAEEINFLEGCMLYFMFGTLLSTGLFCWLCLSYFSGTWPTVCCDGIALRGMGTQHGWDCQKSNTVHNHSWIFQEGVVGVYQVPSIWHFCYQVPSKWHLFYQLPSMATPFYQLPSTK